jgi:nucleotide-binding universal stress UspA family protein
MFEMTTILATTDFSSTSALAVDRGFLLARDQKARYVLMHALGSNISQALRAIAGDGLNVDDLSDKIMEQTKTQMREIIADCSHRVGVDVELVIEADSASSVIPAYAKKINANLLVIGAHGTGFIQRVLIGSTATRLLRQAHCPVLVVKQPPHHPYRRALVAVDFSPISLTNIKLVQRIAPTAHIVLAHTYEVPFEGKMQMAGVSEDVVSGYREEARVHAINQLADFAKGCNLSDGQFTSIVSHGQADRNILQLEEKYRCDLVVMGKHGKNVTAELLLGSVTKRVLADCLSDVLVATDEEIFPQRIL